MLAHSLAKALLFFSAGIINRQYDNVKIEYIHDLFKMQPLAAFGLIFGSVAIIGTPLLPLFIPKFFILAGLGEIYPALLFVVLLLLVIAAGSFAWFVIQLIQNNGKEAEKYKVPFTMMAPIIILVIALLFFGLYFPDILHLMMENIVTELGV
jgi:hydrogenase-4 component F